jgi:hypothetical protein
MTALSNRVALVTAASRGIGKAIGIALAEAGADIAVNYRAQAEAAESVCQTSRRIPISTVSSPPPNPNSGPSGSSSITPVSVKCFLLTKSPKKSGTNSYAST